MKELEDHIAGETRKLGDAVDRRLDVLQTGMHDLSAFVTEQPLHQYRRARPIA